MKLSHQQKTLVCPTISSITGIRSGPGLPEHKVKCSQSGNSFPEFLDASWMINNCRKLETGSESQWCLWIHDLPPVLLSEDLYERQDLLGKALMTSFAEMLDLPPETFAQCFEGGVHTRVWSVRRLQMNVKQSLKIPMFQYERTRHMDDVWFSRSWMMLMHSNSRYPRSAYLLLEFQGQDMGTIRLLRYPPAETAEEAARRQVASYGISPHTDFEVP